MVNKTEYAKKWRHDNPEKVKAQNRRAYLRDPDKSKARNKHWRESHPDLFAYQKKKTGAKVRGLSWNIDRDWYLEHIWNHSCAFCGEETCGGMDRIDSTIGYEQSNVIPCCTWCNSIKYTATLMELRIHLLKILPKLDAILEQTSSSQIHCITTPSW